MNDPNEFIAMDRRLRIHYKAIQSDATFRESPYWRGQSLGWDKDKIDEDESTLARAYMAEHPEDECSLADPAWCTSIGSIVVYDPDIDSAHSLDPLGKISIVFRHVARGGGSALYVYGGKVKDDPTRGDVRVLAGLMGVVLKETV